MKVAVIGSRTFNNYALLQNALNNYCIIECIVSGGANGADKLAEKYAKEKGIKTEIFYPDYALYNKIAPLIRNRKIVECSDVIIAFWDMKSRGTMHALNYAKSLNKEVKVINFKT